MGKVRIEFELDLADNPAYPSKTKEDFPVLVENLHDWMRQGLICNHLRRHGHYLALAGTAKTVDERIVNAHIVFHSILDEHLGRQAEMNTKMTLTADDGSVMETSTPDWAKKMAQDEFPDIVAARKEMKRIQKERRLADDDSDPDYHKTKGAKAHG